MQSFSAATVYIDDEVYARANCRARLERVLPRISAREVRAYDAEARAAVAGIGRRRHGKDGFGDEAVVVFTTFDAERAWWYYHWRDEAAACGGACQPALELNLIDGCIYRCAYCGFGRALIFYLDVERLLDGLDAAFARHPAQRLFKYSNMTDLPPLRPSWTPSRRWCADSRASRNATCCSSRKAATSTFSAGWRMGAIP